MLVTTDLYLASASPRRGELLQQIGVSFERCVADIDERQQEGESPKDYVCRLATEKAQAVRGKVVGSSMPILGSDTIVVLDGDVLGKPVDEHDALQMLARLSNNWHEVLTAVALIGEGGEECICSTTRVHMAALSQEGIRAYVASEAVLDKAGAYGIQGLAASFIDRIEGSYSGVMGLPLYETTVLLQRFGIKVLTEQ